MDLSGTPAAEPDTPEMSPEAAARAERHYRNAVKAAVKATSGAPWLADEMESAAYVWVCQAAVAYVEGIGTEEEAWILWKVKMLARDYIRRLNGRGPERPAVHSLSDVTAEPGKDDTGHAAVETRDEAERWLAWMGDREAEMFRAFAMEGKSAAESAAAVGLSAGRGTILRGQEAAAARREARRWAA